jgi:hypothetical protein
MNRLALVLVLAVTAGCSSASSDGLRDSVASTTAPQATATNSLERALRRLGVDVDAAPTGARQLGDARFCGAERRGAADRAGNPAARRCFVDGNAAKRPVVFVFEQTTVEGDPIVTIYRSGPSGSVDVSYDATRDKFGSGRWEHQQCAGITTEFPDAPAPLPDDYFEATGCAEVGVPD